MLAKSMRFYRETLAADVFVRGATNARTAPDGLPLFSNVHIIERTGGIINNLLGTTVGDGPALSVTAIQ